MDFQAIRSTLRRQSVNLSQVFGAAQSLAAPEALAAWEGPTQRVAVLSGLTPDFVARAAACAIFREGVFPIVYSGLFGAYVQEILDPSSGLHAFKPDLVVLALDWRDVVGESAPRIEFVESLLDALERSGYPVYLHTIAPPTLAYRGMAERLEPASAPAQVAQINAHLIARGRVHWVDVERLSARVGLERWSPERFYVNGRLPFDPRFVPSYMKLFGGAWRAGNARAKKVLALDLDNTLWGGVIGDDGVEGIALGPDAPGGEAFARWGEYVKALGARGVVLAVCSKNDPALAAAAFDHPHSALKVGDFAAFECSWDDKVTALRRIAAALNVGIDSFVFADDNPVECALVRAELPEAGVLELGSDASTFAAALEEECWFDASAYTQEDVRRGRSYAARREVEAARASAPDMNAFLATLEMRGELADAAESDLARVAQLEQKTNQFNLTTRRYDDAAIRAFFDRDDATMLVFRLRDRYADHGLVSTLVAVREGTNLRIDSWLMSCRVFSRTAEAYIARGLIARAREIGAETISGEYVPTAKNGVVANLFASLGFSPAGDGRWWTLDVRNGAALPALETAIEAAPAQAVS